MDVLKVEKCIKALGRLAMRATRVEYVAGGLRSDGYIGPTDEGIQALKLEDATLRCAEIMRDAVSDGVSHSTLKGMGVRDVAKAFQALFSDTPWTLVTGCYPDAGMEPKSFLVEGDGEHAMALLSEYKTSVAKGQIEPARDLPDPEFQVIESCDQRGAVLQLVQCSNDAPDLSRRHLEALRHQQEEAAMSKSRFGVSR